MTIGVDIRALQNKNRFRGIGRYLENILRALAPLTLQDHYVFFVEGHSPLPEDILKLFKSYETRVVRPSRIKHIKYVRALVRPQVQLKVPSGSVDVFFQADPWLGIPGNVPTVATFHDIIPLLFKIPKESMQLNGIKKYKQIFGETIQDKFYTEMLASYKKATLIIAISQSSKNDYIKYGDTAAASKVRVVAQASAENSFPNKISEQTLASVRRKYGVADVPFVLYVGGIDLRKNIKQLAEDFVELKQTHSDLKMIMVGKEFNLRRDLKMVGWTDVLNRHPKEAKDILLPGYVPDNDMAALYKQAAVFVFPSLYEGFGLPILEAMQLGCPVVCYDNSSLPEVTSDAALIVKNGQPMAAAIAQILDNPKLRKELVEKGRLQAKKFNWNKAGLETLQVLKEAAGVP